MSFIRVALVMVFLHSNENPKTEIGTRDWGIAMIGLTMFVFRGMGIRKAVNALSGA